jgi:hypothetical protein
MFDSPLYYVVLGLIFVGLVGFFIFRMMKRPGDD